MPETEISRRCIDSEVKKADAAIITLGRQAGENVDRLEPEEFNLTALEHELIENVSDAFHMEGKPVVVIINSGSVIETASWSDKADAILLAWQPGEEGGNSVADVLTGKANPSGKLTMTWPVSSADHYSSKNFPKEMSLYRYRELRGWGWDIPNYDITNHEEDIYVGYRYFDTFHKEVAYPFGYGLSYTTFAYGKPVVETKGEDIIVTANIKNTGECAGKEVAQVYVAAPKGRLQKPSHELKAFAKTRELKPGESETLRMTIAKRDLASYDEANSQWLVDEGTYTFYVGANSRDMKGSATLPLTGMAEKTGNRMAPQHPLNLLRQ